MSFVAVGVGLGGAALGTLSGVLGGDNAVVNTVDAGQATELETMGLQAQQQRFRELESLVTAGAGKQDIMAALQAQRGFADQLQAAGSGLPTSSDISQAQGITGQLFAPQQLAMQQAFEDQSIQANRQAALLGRAGNDPILQARLAQEQTRQQALLGAQQGAASTQLAMALPGQRLSLAGQRAQVLGGLATQAMQNRQALTALGGQLVGQEREFRLATATRRSQEERSIGDRIAGGLSGALGGFTAGMGAMTNLGTGKAIQANLQARTQNVQAMTQQGQSAFGGGGGFNHMNQSIFEAFPPPQQPNYGTAGIPGTNVPAYSGPVRNYRLGGY